MKQLITIILSCLCSIGLVAAQSLPAADSTAKAPVTPVTPVTPIADSTKISAADSAAISTPPTMGAKTTRRKLVTKPKADTVATAPHSIDSTHTQAEIGTLDVAWKPVPINHSIGIRGGWGMGSMRREPTKEGATLPFSLWNGGFSYRFDIPEQKYVGTISFDLDYMQKGYAYKLLFSGDEAYAHRFDVLQLSIIWQPYLPLSRKTDSRMYLIAGPFVSYTINGGVEQEFNTATGEINFERPYTMDPMSDYYLNYGITAGLGFQIAFGKFAISADARYNIQLSDIVRGPEFIPGNPFRTPVDHINVSLGFHYNFLLGK